ncbi:hypothetical protein CFE70_010003 [Pyrenophora teres f. teres 0-1]
MSTDNRASGLLNNLQKLDKAGLERILKVLLVEDVILILITSLWERDSYVKMHRVRSIVKGEYVIIDLDSKADSEKDEHVSGVKPKRLGKETTK